MSTSRAVAAASAVTVPSQDHAAASSLHLTTDAPATPCVVSSNALIFAADFTASWTAYIVALLASHPFDTLRVRKQTSSRSVVAIVQRDGVRSLYSGLLTPIFSNGPIVASIFAFNEFFRSFYRWANTDLLGRHDLRVEPCFTHGELFAAGTSAGFVASMVSCPASFIRIQQQIRGKKGAISPSAPQVLREIVAHNGVTGMWRALPLEATTNGIGRGVYFLGYEVLKQQVDVVFRVLMLKKKPNTDANISTTSVRNSNNNSNVHSHQDNYLSEFQSTTLRNFIAAAMTSSIGWLSIFPAEVLKVKMQGDALVPGTRRFTSIGHCAVDTYRNFGVRGFWRGMPLTVMKSWISSGLALPLYDILKPHCRSWVPRCPEDTSPQESFGKPQTRLRDLFADPPPQLVSQQQQQPAVKY